MLTDAFLAFFHFLAIFLLVTLLAAEAVVLRPGMTPAIVRRLSLYDLLYFLSAMVVLATGLLRLFYGAKGVDFYLHNPWFHAKMGAFVLVGLLSILPTVRFLRWRKALAANPIFLPDASETARMRAIIRFELVLLAAIFVFAAAMARYGGLSL